MEFIKEIKAQNFDKVLIELGAENVDVIGFCKENKITVIEQCASVQLSRYEK